MNTEKTGLSIYGVEKFNRLLYAVHPCNSNIRQGRETAHPHSPPFTKTLQVSTKATSQCCKWWKIRIAGRCCGILSLFNP